MEERNKTERSGGFPAIRLILWTVAVFCVGYVAAGYGPSVDEILRRWGVELHPIASDGPAYAHEDAQPPSAADDVRALLAEVGAYVSRLNTRIGELESGLKENGIAQSILAKRDGADPAALRRLDEERGRFQDSLAGLEQDLAEALDLEARLRSLLDAASGRGQSAVRGSHTVADARHLLERLDLLGLPRQR